MAAVSITMNKFIAATVIAILVSAIVSVGVFTMLIAGAAVPAGASRSCTVLCLREVPIQSVEANARGQLCSDASEEVYWELLYDVGNELSSSENHNFESPLAKTLVEQARSDYDLAISFANQGNYGAAVSSLEDVLSYLEEAAIKEQRFIEERNQQLFLAAAIVLAISVVIAVIIFLGKRRKR